MAQASNQPRIENAARNLGHGLRIAFIFGPIFVGLGSLMLASGEDFGGVLVLAGGIGILVGLFLTISGIERAVAKFEQLHAHSLGSSMPPSTPPTEQAPGQQPS